MDSKNRDSSLIPFEAYEGSKPYMFVSYAHKDKQLVYLEIKRLHEAGYRIWYDEGIPPATEWPEEIARAIEKCAFFLVFISTRAVQSKYILNEIHYALKKDKAFLAIYIEAVKLSSGLDFEIGRLQAIMKFQLSEKHYYQKLNKVLPASLKRSSLPLRSPPTRSKKIDYIAPSESISPIRSSPISQADSPLSIGDVTPLDAETVIFTESFYSERFWKKNWDKGLDDLDPQEFETTCVDLIKPIFEKYPDKIALTFKGVEITFRELDNYSNQFANMLVENGFNKGDIIGINLPNTPEFVIAVIGALRVGCIVSGISPLLSPAQIQYQLSD